MLNWCKFFICNSIICLLISSIFFDASIANGSTKLKIYDYFENLKTLEADFVQVSPSGIVSNGKVYFDFPGKLRIDYKKPSNILITSKGYWIVIQDRKTQTTNNIPLKGTPFSLFLENKMNSVNKDVKLDFHKNSGIISLKITSINNEQAGELVLEFSEKPLNLKKWIIKDAFGDITTVFIQNARYNNELSHLLFFPDDFPEPIN